MRSAFTLIEMVVLTALYLVMMFSPGEHSSWAVYCTNAPIVLYSLVCLLTRSDRSYSARKFFFLFVLFFMGLAPLMQYKTGAQTVGGYEISEDTYIYVNLLMIGVLAIFDSVYFYSYHHIRRPLMRLEPRPEVSEESRRKWRMVLLGISLICVGVTIWYFHREPLRLIIRSFAGDDHDYSTVRTGQTYLRLLMEWIVRPLPAIVCITYWAFGRNRLYKWLLTVLMLVTCFPTSIERIRVAAYYIPLLIIMFPSLRKHNRFVNLFFGALIVVFPLLNYFRRWGQESGQMFQLDGDLFTTNNFDSYQSLAFAFQNHYTDFMTQAQEFLLFWVPRYFWADKPQAAGYRMAHDYDLSYDFISMNYWGEGYVLCGIFGVALFTVLLAWVLAKADKTYWNTFGGSTTSYYAPFFLLFLPLLFYILRGDLVGAIITTVTILGLNYLVYRITRHFFR